MRELEIDRAIYKVDDETQSYRFLKRNPRWKQLDSVRNENNKARIDGFTRIFRDGHRKAFRFRPKSVQHKVI